jgi:hypothetical protein
VTVGHFQHEGTDFRAIVDEFGKAIVLETTYGTTRVQPWHDEPLWLFKRTGDGGWSSRHRVDNDPWFVAAYSKAFPEEVTV